MKTRSEKKMIDVDALLANVQESVVEKAVGHQKSKWDAFIPKFDVPGKTLHFPSGLMTAQAASNMVKTLERKTGHFFHSYVDNTKGGMIAVRRREEGWKPSVTTDNKGEEARDEEE